MNKKQIIQSFKDSFGDDEFAYVKHVREVGKTTVMCEFVDWLDFLQKDGQITESQRCHIVATENELFGSAIVL